MHPQGERLGRRSFIAVLSPFLNNMEHTIAAISTAYGEAGIGVVRLSGEDALAIAKKLTGRNEFKDRYMHHCFIGDSDEALVCYMKAPHSYTGEDVVEIQCHGSSASLSDILAKLYDLGAAPAEPGEFTKRAFLNGRLDLSRAEAVIDLIKAKTKRSLGSAAAQLRGGLSDKVSSIRKSLKDLLVELTVNMDYPDEDIEEITYQKLKDSLSAIDDELLKLLSSAEEGRILRDGLQVAIIGKPNVGKSSLMNIFMGEERSIVTNIPGTTRDTVEENAQIRGIPVRLVDTAGIRESDDTVERIGIERSRRAFSEADLVLLILDSSRPLSDEDKELLKASEGSDALVILNKSDLKPEFKKEDLKTGLKVIETSALSGAGLDEIRDEIERRAVGGSAESRETPLLSNLRHIRLVKNAEREIAEALEMTGRKEAMDFIEVNCNAAFEALGEITGDAVSGEIVDEIFARFCLGK